jgi:hypothetical protein
MTMVSNSKQSDESLEEEYDMYQAGAESSNTHSPLFTDSWDENVVSFLDGAYLIVIGLTLLKHSQMAASITSEPPKGVFVMEVDRQISLEKGKKRVASVGALIYNWLMCSNQINRKRCRAHPRPRQLVLHLLNQLCQQYKWYKQQCWQCKRYQQQYKRYNRYQQ